MDLEPTSSEIEQAFTTLAGLTAGFLADLPVHQAYVPGVESTHERPRGFADRGAGLTAALDELMGRLCHGGLYTASGRYFGFIPGGGLVGAAFGDFLAALTNRYAGLYMASPAACAVENEVTSWLLTQFGMPETAWGTLTSGGSLANLVAVLAARETRPRDLWQRSTVYTTKQAHGAVKRALKIAGIDLRLVRDVPVDDKWRLDVHALEEHIRADLQAGLAPWMIMASLGTTNTGSVDPLPHLIALKHKYQLWLHLDAAYGGFFVMTDYGRAHFKGIGEADSLAVDPHKGLFMPYGLGAALVRQGDTLRQAFATEAAYLADFSDPAHRSPNDYSPELTRHFRGARLYVCLKAFGVKPFVAALDEKLRLTRYAYEELRKLPSLEFACEPELTVIAFRDCRGDEATQKLLEGIIKKGRVFLSSTRLGGRLYLRLVVLSFRSHQAEVDECLAAIRIGLQELA